MHVVGCHWVFRIKERDDGALEHYKAFLNVRLFETIFMSQPSEFKGSTRLDHVYRL